MSISKDRFQSTKKLIPAMLYGCGTTLLIYFITMSAIDSSVCEKGTGYDVCIKQIPIIKSWLTNAVVLLVGIAVVLFTIIFVNDFFPKKEDSKVETQTERKSPI